MFFYWIHLGMLFTLWYTLSMQILKHMHFSVHASVVDTNHLLARLMHEVVCYLHRTAKYWCCYNPILLTYQMHADYMVSAHNILILEKYSVVFVRCMDNNQQLDGFFYSSKCGIPLTRTVIAQWSKAQVSHLMVVRLSQLGSRFFYIQF